MPSPENKGVAPPDPETEVGRVRYLIGDTEYVELEPPEEGFGSYQVASDGQIEAALIRAEGNENRTAGYVYTMLASQAAVESKMVQDYDLRLDTTKRAADLRAAAQMWFDLADEEDDAEGLGDIFEFTPVGAREKHVHPELTPWPYRGR